MQRRQFLIVSTAVTATAASSVAVASVSQPLHASNTELPCTLRAELPFTVKAGEARFGVHTPFQGINVNDLKISGKDTSGQLAVFEYVGKERVGPPLHMHTDQDEIFSIIEGDYLFQVGESTFTAHAGDTVFGPRNIPHTWVQRSAVGKMTYFAQPAGKLEAFFLKMNELKGPPTEEVIQKIHKDHGMIVLGPPLSPK